MAIAYFRKPRIFVNGVDISSLVREFVIEARVGEVTQTRITLWGQPTMSADGTIEFTTRENAQFTGPVLTPLGPMRGIRFSVEPDEPIHESAEPGK